MKRTLIFAVFTIALMGNTACGTGSKVTPAETELLGCSSFASALTVVTGLNNEGKLNANTVEVVDHARETVNPICQGQAPDVNSTAKDILVDSGARALLAIAAQFGR